MQKNVGKMGRSELYIDEMDWKYGNIKQGDKVIDKLPD